MKSASVVKSQVMHKFDMEPMLEARLIQLHRRLTYEARILGLLVKKNWPNGKKLNFLSRFSELVEQGVLG